MESSQDSWMIGNDNYETIHPHCRFCIQVTKCAVPRVLNESCEIIGCELKCGFHFHACKLPEHRLLCVNEKVPCINANYGCPIILARRQQARHLEVCPASVVTCTMEWNRWLTCFQERKACETAANTERVQQLDVALALRDQRTLTAALLPGRRRSQGNRLAQCGVPPPQPPPLPLLQHPQQPAGAGTGAGETAGSPGVNLTVESIARYQSKPSNMCTFLCAQEFRRDEYTWHCKNVHSDIHAGLNGWLEHRCPLAYYGCVYSLCRLYPSTKGAAVVHSDILESFGVQPYVKGDWKTYVALTNSEVNSNVDQSEMKQWNGLFGVEDRSEFCALPFEILRYVCRFLDSFSLCNMALTCRRLRDVCCSLLEERGIVVQHWHKTTNGPCSKWRVTHKRWFFSTAFSPIRTWGFEEGHMSNHLQHCTFFQRNTVTREYFHLFGATPSPRLQKKLGLLAHDEASDD